MDLSEKQMHDAYLARVQAEIMFIYFKSIACLVLSVAVIALVVSNA